MNIITDNLAKLRALCQRHKVKALYVFGSVLTERFREDSDIDLTVTFNDSEVQDPFVNFFDFQEALENLFTRKVDLVDFDSISNSYFKQEVARTRQQIYG